MDILKMLNELESMVEQQHRRSFLSLTYGFDYDTAMDMLQQIRVNLPDEVKRADRVTRDSEKIVGGAREAAEQTLEEASAEANQISREARVTAERLVRDAEAQAQKMTQQAEERAKQTVGDARQKAEQMLVESHKQSQVMV
ncbi:MAG: hypothetical protein M3Y13_02110, partial [Armatimonadota bacterium]|nr:hypothetical protein [Armatimonadota bacterium]